MSQLPNRGYNTNNPKAFPYSQQMVYDASCIGGNFAQGSQSAYQIWDVSPTGFDLFIADKLGWSDSDGKSITRHLPAKHPSSFSLWASSVGNIQGIAPQGQFDNANGIDSAWKTYRVTVNYEAPPYQLLDDKEILGAFDVPEEWTRYVKWSFEPSIEYIERKRNTFNFDANVPDGLGGVLPPLQRKISGTYGSTLRLVKKKITATWFQVPDNFLFNGGSFNSSASPKQDAGLGLVNDAEFMGYPAGTLMFNGFTPIAVTQPVPLTFLHGTALVALAWNVDMHFTWFDPPRLIPGYPYTDGIDGRGHNLVPHPTLDYWFPAYLAGYNGVALAPARPRYLGYDFELLFEGNG